MYRERRLVAIAAAMGRERSREKPSAALPRAAVPGRGAPCAGWRRRRWCRCWSCCTSPTGCVPFFVYHYFTGDEGDSIPLAVLYSVAAFVLAELATFGVAIAGKWLVLGRAKPGRYPLWGVAYFRWWLADRLSALPPVSLLTGTPWLGWYLRALGARIGRDVLIDSVSVRAPDLLSIEDGASVGTAVHIENARVEGGMLILGPVRLGRESVVDSYAVLENDTAVGAGARLSGLSALAAGRRIPDGETWEGAPARRVDRVAEQLPPRPVVGRGVRIAQALFFAVAGLAVAVLFFMPLFPSFILIDWMDVHLWNLYENEVHAAVAFAAYFLLAIPASVLLVLATVLLAAGLRRLFLPRQMAGVWSGAWPGLLPEMAHDPGAGQQPRRAPRPVRLGLCAGLAEADGRQSRPRRRGLHGHGHRARPARAGRAQLHRRWRDAGRRGAARRLDGAAADGHRQPLVRGQRRLRVRRRVGAGRRADRRADADARQFAAPVRPDLDGVAAAAAAGARAADGVRRVAHVPALAAALAGAGRHRGAAHRPAAGVPDRHRLPDRADRHAVRRGRGRIWLAMAGALALAGCLFGLASFLLVVALKWILVGRYRPRAAPMWTLFVWLSEAVTSLYESLAVPNLLDLLRGTPMLPWALRLLGAHMGRESTWTPRTSPSSIACGSATRPS